MKSQTAPNEPMKYPDKQHLEWMTGHHTSKNGQPGQWLKAEVPGAVQLDMLPYLDQPGWQFADGYKQFLWMEDVFWTYRSDFSRPRLAGDERLFFISKGIDYHFEIHLNGTLIHEQEGMFTPVHLDITDHLKDQNRMEIILFPVPKSVPAPPDRNQADHSFKPAVSYGWDWHPRLVPSGIWDETYLEVKNKQHIQQLDYSYQLDDSLKQAAIRLTGSCTYPATSLRLTVSLDNKTVLSKEWTQHQATFDLSHDIEEVKLWWPWELGDQNIYECTLQLLDEQARVLDQKGWKWGFRKVRLVMNEHGWENPGFPKSRSKAPATIEINGIKIFARGTNWVNPEIFPGTITPERYETLIRLAGELNFNLLRIWGGAIVNKDSFYDLCDEYGIMVWQDFPLACNDYPDDPQYLSVLKQEASSIIHRLKRHPSLALWCGGNELFNAWSGMDDQSLAIRWLNSLCLQLTPEIPFIPTSPVTGIGHGHYLFFDRGSGEDVFQLMNRSRHSALTEFGMPSPSDASILKTIIPEDELFPPSPTEAWKAHHAYEAWVDQTWLCEPIIEKYFGPSASLEELVANGQKLQAIGYQAIYEHARQRWPECSMALNWCFNEPWPAAANNSIIQYPATPKPCFESIKKACRPALASARIPKFTWLQDEDLTFTLFLINSTQHSLPPVLMEVYLNGRKIDQWNCPGAGANTNTMGPEVSCPVKELKDKWIKLELKVPGRPELNSEYDLVILPD